MTLDPAGEHVAAFAAATPDKPAVVMHPSGVTRTYAELDAASARLARVLRDRGLRRGDHLAVLLDNQPEFFDAVWAANRIGLYVTPINWHLTGGEAGYIVADCDAAALVATARLADVVGAMGDDLGGVTTRIAVDGDLPGFERYADLVDGVDAGPLDDETEGSWMLYSSGTTGKPKGILPSLPEGDLGAPSMITWMLRGMFGMTADAVYLSPAPLYHASPAGWTHGVQRIGATPVVMEQFDPIELLAAIERHRVTHVQLVPTMMIRLLKLAEEERQRFDLSSLEMVIHAAAPCPVEVKRGASSGWARSSTSSTAAARAPGSATSGPRSGSPTPARSASR